MTTTNPESDDDVHRLIDMVVEEVSLVDRAANQRRFLLVKRSQAVTTENEDTDTPNDDIDAEPTPDEGGGDEGAGSGADAPPAGGDAPASPAPGGASTEAVVAALEALTGVVEVLATQTTEKAKKPAKPPIDDEEDLEDGGADEAEEDAEPDVPEEDAPPSPRRGPPPKKKTKAADPLADVRAQLARIESALGRKPAKKREPTPSNEIATRLAEVAKMLGELKAQVAGQAGRLAKVEKHVGAPASKPVDGPRKPGGDDVSWPLDINAPRDKASVDTAVSFH